MHLFYPIEFHRGNESIDQARKILNEKLIHTNSTLIKLESLFAALMLGEDWAFEKSYDDLSSSLFSINDGNSLNPHLGILAYRSIFETQLIFSLTHSKEPLDVYKLQDLNKLTRAHLQLFTEVEISGFALRVELNSLVILFLQGNFEELLNRLTEWSEQTKVNRFAAYYPDVIALEIISRLELGGHYDEDLDKRLVYYEGHGKKNTDTVPLFHRTFANSIKGFRNATSQKERDATLQNYCKKLRMNKEMFNHFHHLFLNWVERKIALN